MRMRARVQRPSADATQAAVWRAKSKFTRPRRLAPGNRKGDAVLNRQPIWQCNTREVTSTGGGFDPSQKPGATVSQGRFSHTAVPKMRPGSGWISIVQCLVRVKGHERGESTESCVC